MSETTTPTNPPRKRTGRKVLLGLLTFVLVSVLSVGGFYLWSVNNALTGMPREDLMPDDSPIVVEQNVDLTPNLGVPNGGTQDGTTDTDTETDTDAEGTAGEEGEGQGQIPITNDDVPVIEGGIAEPGGEINPARPNLGAAGSFNYLLLGSDSRGSDRGRSDVMMLAHVPPSRDKVYLISFTRDMWVTIPGRGAAKINAAYAYGGVPLAVRTVESLIGTRIDHAMMINFGGFMGLTDALGGVTVNNRQASPGYPAGQITISGERALSYVRERYNLRGGDLARAERQRAVMTAIIQKMMSADVLANPAKFNDVASRLGTFVTVDQGLTNGKIFETATSLRIRGAADVVSLQAPLAGFGRSRGGQAINIVDWPKMRQMASHIQNGTMASYPR